MSNLLALSESIAREAHHGQLYDVRDYVEGHVAPIVSMIAKLGYGEKFQAVGWLHDVPEDSDITVVQLIERGIPTDVAGGVDLMTKKGEPHEVYLGKIATDPLSVVRKFWDSSVNLANTILRASEIETERFIRWTTTYTGNLSFLLPLLPPTK